MCQVSPALDIKCMSAELPSNSRVCSILSCHIRAEVRLHRPLLLSLLPIGSKTALCMSSS